MINILLFTRVKAEYAISYDSENFIIHRAKSGQYADMVFKPHLSGLHVYDEEEPRGHACYLFVEMVKYNISIFTKHQVASANLVHKLQAGLLYPSVDDLRWIVKTSMLKDNPVTNQNVNVALKIWGLMWNF